MTTSKYLLYMSDPHCGHRFGLLPYGVTLPPIDDQGGRWTPEMTETQKRMADLWEKDIKEVNEIAKRSDLLIVVGGDVTQGDQAKYPDKELVSPRQADQHMIAWQTFEPLVKRKNCLGIRFVKGTGSHVFGHGSSEILLAEYLNELGYNADTVYHYEIEYGGPRFDVSHHGPSPGIREWTAGNQVRYYVRSIMSHEIANGRTPPDAVLRGHYHERRLVPVEYSLETETLMTWGVIAPSYSLADDYTRKATRSKRHIHVGVLLAEIYKGRIVHWHELIHDFDLAKREVIE